MNESNPSNEPEFTYRGDVHAKSAVIAQRVDVIKQVIQHPPAKLDPKDIPRPPKPFYNREDLLDELSAIVDDDPGATILVNGWREIGKTAFVYQWASISKSRFPDARVYVDMNKYSHYDDPMFEVLNSLVRRLGAASEQLSGDREHLHAVYLALTHSLTGLIIVDNVRHDEDARYLTPASENFVIIATSETHLLGTEFESLTVRALPHDYGRQILGTYCGSERIAAEPAAVNELLVICGGLPNALRAIGKRLQRRKKASIQRIVDGLKKDEDPVLRVFKDLYEAFDASTARLYRRLGAAPTNEFDEYLAAAMAELDIETARASLESLHDSFMVDEIGDGIYSYPETVARHIDYCAKHDETAETLRQTKLIAAARYKYLVEQADVAATGNRLRIDEVNPNTENPPFDTEEEALTWLHDNLESIRSVFHQAIEEDRPDDAWKLAEHLWAYYSDVRGQSSALDTYIAATEAAKAAENPEAISRMLALKTKTYNDLGQYEVAVQTGQEALHYAHQVTGNKGPRLQASALEFIGRSQQKSGQGERAMMTYQESFDIAIEHDLVRHQSLIMRFMGETMLQMNQPREAAESFTNSIQLLHTLPEDKPRDLAIVNLELGRVHVNVGDITQARKQFRTSINFARQSGRFLREAQGWQAMADVASTPEEQVENLQHAITALEPINDPQIQSITSQLNAVKSQFELE